MLRIFIPLLFLIVIDIYAWQGVATATQDSSRAIKRTAAIAYWAGSVIIYISILSFAFGYSKHLPHFISTFTLALFFISFPFKILSVLPLMLEDLCRLLNGIYRFIVPGESLKTGFVSRKKFLSQVAVGIGATAFLGFFYGIVKGAHHYEVRKVKVKLSNLPKSFSGLKIAQISDIHSGSFWNRSAVEKGVQMLLDQKPDIVFFTGDLVNESGAEMDKYKEIFSRIKAPMGVYSILGNHDYGEYTTPKPTRDEVRANAQNIASIHREMGWDVLLNEHRILQKGEDKIALIGIENFGVGFQQYGKLYKAYEGTETYPVKLLLSHDPSHWRYEVLKNFPDIDISFAGHTHGMQIGIETANWQWSPIKYRYPEWGGLYNDGKQYIHVNRGFGYLGYPGRLGIRPEISIIELEMG